MVRRIAEQRVAVVTNKLCRHGRRAHRRESEGWAGRVEKSLERVDTAPHSTEVEYGTRD